CPERQVSGGVSFKPVPERMHMRKRAEADVPACAGRRSLCGGAGRRGMSGQLARYLKDFSPPPRVRPSLFPSSGQNAGGASPDASALSFPDPPVDVAAERAEAFAEGRAEAEAELGARHAAALAALAETHRAEMETMKSRYEQDYATALAERFSTLADEVADRIAGEAAMVLAPVLEDALTGRAVEDLARMVREGLHAGEAVTVTVKGPSALFEQL